MRLATVILTVLVVESVLGANVVLVGPKDLANLFSNPIKAHVSPIGFKPLSGRLQGSIMLADPVGACSKIKDVKSESEDFFVLADDTQCLQSVKAKNIAASGGYAGIIKQNPNNTLFDKQISLVHIPILQIAGGDYSVLETYLKKNPETRVTLSIDFTDETQTHPVNVEFWFSPTEVKSYAFLLEMRQFLRDQTEVVSFVPHYVLQSQRENKNYIGCLSSGRYCPSEIEYEGRYQGKTIVQQSLRQIIIWDMNEDQWWKYIQYFYLNCLKSTVDIFLDNTKLSACIENSMIMAGINTGQLKTEYNNSFLGTRKEVDDNTYLLEERQLYIREQLTSHPTVLINKKAFGLESPTIQERICKMQGDNPTDTCRPASDQLSTGHVFIILSVILALFIAVAALYRLYMHIRMRRQIKSEVDKTLEQYYRYIATFEGQNGNVGSLGKKKSGSKSRKLNQDLEQIIVPEKAEVVVGKQLQMAQVQK